METVEQLPETLWIENELYRLHTAPLAVWLRQNGPIAFEQRSDACQRGYVGRWEIREGALWLIDLHGWCDGKRVRHTDLFNISGDVRAAWYSGQLVFEPAQDTLKEGTKALLQRVSVQDGMLMANRPGPI
ncbi:MAG TPA: hypothetical protein DCL95_02770 [Rhodospirillaceae bacterium]|nr:hypothetical protein [Rhodospirillaceae bacterium]MAX62605.1 hypothetical protein [Rhodospirillaceae bacterium]MBB57005.1 hypothetical protein [Rhodospirillaceae bacterium]HAJ18975.1 hypothetical protein [Rhodospirillaceae bacterium]|tara:strand:+ start:581 stop:970 length:390 start_codon:yes stop_codon:yes gene_type:complete